MEGVHRRLEESGVHFLTAQEMRNEVASLDKRVTELKSELYDHIQALTHFRPILEHLEAQEKNEQPNGGPNLSPVK